MEDRRSGLLACLAVALLAGCSGPTPPMVETDAELPPPPSAETDDAVANEIRSEDVYHFAGLLTDNTTETFEAPAGTVGLTFEFPPPSITCAGDVKVDVVRPNGGSAYHSIRYICAGPYYTTEGVEETFPGLGPGNYTVHYLITGAIDFEFSAKASVSTGGV